MALVPMHYPYPNTSNWMGLYEDPYLYDIPPPSCCPRRPRKLKIDFYTCGRRYHPEVGSTPVILNMSCAKMLPPPTKMVQRYTGLDRKLSDWLFSHREYRVKCTRALDRIDDAIDAWRPSRDGPRLCVIVKCKAGVHRSVAMAERLAKEVRGWEGVRVSIEYVFLSRLAVVFLARIITAETISCSVLGCWSC